jgi:type IV pilus assembly protein PilM
VQDRQGLAEAAGLKPVVLDIESYASRMAAARLIERCRGGHGPVVALFEVGAMTTSMQVMRMTRCCMSATRPSAAPS